MGYNDHMFRNVILIVFIAVIALMVTSYFFFKEKSEFKSKNLNGNEKNISVGGVNLLVDIADEPSEQAQGLSGRDLMAENKGMLFIFPESLIPSFWMKDMRFPLDMLWVDASGTIIAITKNIPPETYPNIFSPPSPILYVLEVNSGWSDRNNIKVGDMMFF